MTLIKYKKSKNNKAFLKTQSNFIYGLIKKNQEGKLKVSYDLKSQH